VNSYQAYNLAQAAADRASSAINERLQAEKDVALRCDGLAFDANSAADVYRAGLDHLGVPRRETAGLNAAALRVILKNIPRSGSGGVAAMAFDDVSGNSTLDAILKDITAPRNLTGRGEI